MSDIVNTEEKVKIPVPIEVLIRLRKSLPYGALSKVASELGVHSQYATIELTRLDVDLITPDNKSKFVDREVLMKVLRIIRETGNPSFDDLYNLCHEA